MKTLITSALLLGSLFIAPALALADTSTPCPAPGHPVYASDDSTITSCVSDAAWQASLEAAAVAQNDKHLPVVASGATLTDEAGTTYQVPNIVYIPGWLDLTHTDDYRAQMRFIASQTQGFPSMTYWLNH